MQGASMSYSLSSCLILVQSDRQSDALKPLIVSGFRCPIHWLVQAATAQAMSID